MKTNVTKSTTCLALIAGMTLCSASARADLTHYYSWDVDGTDVSGNGNDGTFLGNASVGAGQVGVGRLALQQGTTGTGYQGAFRLPAATSAPTPAMSWSMWIRIPRLPPGPGATGNSESFLMGYVTNGTNNPNLQLRINGGSGVWQVGQWDGSSYVANNSGAYGNLINTGWRHVAASRAADGTTRLYVDGTFVRQFAMTNTLPGTLQSVVVGALENGTGNFIGPVEDGIDDLRIFNNALSDSEVAALAVAPVNATWNVDANGTWGTDGNWDAGASPNAVPANAILGNAINADRTISITSPVAVQSLVTRKTGTGAYTVNLGGSASLSADSVGVAAGTLVLAGSVNSAVKTKSIAIASTGATLRLDGASMVVDYGAASPLAKLTAMVTSGRLATSRQAVGLAEASALGLTSFGGVTGIDSSSVLIRGTLRGDANLDLSVNFDDLLRLAANYNQSDQSWAGGDFNYDGTVNFDDLLVLAANYNQTSGGNLEGDFALAQSIVPEPATLSSMALLAAPVLMRRSRRLRRTTNRG